MATTLPTYYKVKFEYVNDSGMIANKALLIDAPTEKEALRLADEKLKNQVRWHRITGSQKVS